MISRLSFLKLIPGLTLVGRWLSAGTESVRQVAAARRWRAKAAATRCTCGGHVWQGDFNWGHEFGCPMREVGNPPMELSPQALAERAKLRAASEEVL